MRALLLAIMAVGAFGISTVTTAVRAQAVPRQLPPEPPPELPSVSDYSLPPGENQTTPDSAAEGPVEENALPPEAAPAPIDDGPVTPSRTQPVPVGSLPQSSVPSSTRPQDRSLPANGAQPAPSSTVAAPTPTARQTTASSTPDNQAVDSNQPTPGFTTDLPNQAAPAQPAAADPVTQNPRSSAPSATSVTDTIFYYVSGALALLLLFGAGTYFWRRKNAPPLHDREALEDSEILTDVDPEPVSRKPTPKIYSPPNPAGQEKQPALNSGGFVTSKIGMTVKPSPAAHTTPVDAPSHKAPLKTEQSDHLQIKFTASGASSTLLNAVLDYTVTLTNQSDQNLENIELYGAMMQADTETAKGTDVHDGHLLHKIESLASGESLELTGNIRLPLNAIRPITFKSQALFIPLARFIAEYRNQDGSGQQQTASFIVGREYDPPRPKMAPFRLDLGPGSFGPVGQRPLNA